MLLPPQFKDEALKTLGPPIRKEEEKKPVEVEVRPGIYRVNGKLETRIPENEEVVGNFSNMPLSPNAKIITGPVQFYSSEIDIPLPEFKVGDRVRIVSSVPEYQELGPGVVVAVKCWNEKHFVCVDHETKKDEPWPLSMVRHETR